MDVKKICVLGSGTIGYQIAQLCIQHGFDVVLRDIDTSLVEDGAKKIRNGLDEEIREEDR